MQISTSRGSLINWSQNDGKSCKIEAIEKDAVCRLEQLKCLIDKTLE